MAELDDLRRLAGFKAALLSLDHDYVLQECVEEARRQTLAPMAIVSFVMRRVQFFRAAVGLPADLDVTRATARSQSFCQFVVTTEAPFIVTDATRDPRVPRSLSEVYGINSYAGVPVRVHGQILGALCAADEVARQWSPIYVEALRTLAARVSQRLEALATQGIDDDVTAVPPRSLAARAALLAEGVHRSLAEVGPMVRLAQGTGGGMSPEALLRAGRVLADAGDFYEEMMTVMAELCTVTKRVEESVVTLVP